MSAVGNEWRQLPTSLVGATFLLFRNRTGHKLTSQTPRSSKVFRMHTPSPTRAVLLLLLGCSIFLHAQSHVLYLPAPEKPMTVQDVIKLRKAGYSDDLIIEQIKKKQQHFSLTTDQLLQLKTAKVSERVVKYMINPASAIAAPCTTVTAQKPNASTKADNLAGQAIPTDVGVYVKQDGEWVEVSPELVNWKSQGSLKTAASLSFVKGIQDGVVDGPMSKNNFAGPLEFLIVMPEGVAITDYQLVQLHRRGDERDFRIANGGVTHASTDNGRDKLIFVATRISPLVYTTKVNLYAGEYGFLPPDSITARNEAALAKIFTFRIME